MSLSQDLINFPNNEYIINNEYGFICTISRNMFKNWNGYLTIPKTNIHYEKNKKFKNIQRDIIQEFENIYGEIYCVNTDSYLKFGIDTMHLSDIIVKTNKQERNYQKLNYPNATYKDFEFVKNTILKLAQILSQ
jgi:hypothetical protein